MTAYNYLLSRLVSGFLTGLKSDITNIFSDPDFLPILWI